MSVLINIFVVGHKERSTYAENLCCDECTCFVIRTVFTRALHDALVGHNIAHQRKDVSNTRVCTGRTAIGSTGSYSKQWAAGLFFFLVGGGECVLHTGEYGISYAQVTRSQGRPIRCT